MEENISESKLNCRRKVGRLTSSRCTRGFMRTENEGKR
jgi:hypothetical protein